MDRIYKRDWLCLLIGTALMAIATEGFFEHARLIVGGITGIGIMLDDWTKREFMLHIPLWLTNLALNLPLFAYAWYKKGGRFIGKTILTAILFSAMLFLEELFPISTQDPLLAAVFGGTAMGVGLGLVLSAGATTGGVDLAATLLHTHLRQFSVSKLIFALDAAIILAGMAMFGVESSLYAILSIFVTEKWIVWATEGTGFARAAWIISEKNDEIAQALLSGLGRGVTAFPAKGKYSGMELNVLFCVFSQKEIQFVKSAIVNIDRKAFFLVTDIREVLGGDFCNK